MLITDIKIGNRIRKDMGDLRAVADSISRHGLLHPVVISKDGTLIAGHRRIEAMRLLGRQDIDVRMVDVSELLAAERDENTVRKDFTPSEAVAIGRLIEEQEGQRNHEIRSAGAKRRHEIARGVKDVEATASIARGSVRDVAARAVGMGPTKYTQAKAVLCAAEAEPAKFGDLPARMDETGNVKGAHRELEHRRNGTSGRHAIHYKRRHVKAERVIGAALDTLEGVCVGLEGVEEFDSDKTHSKEWAETLDAILVRLRRFSRRLRECK